MNAPELDALSDSELAARYEALLAGPVTAERRAVERELGYRVKAVMYLDAGAVRYRWSDDDDSFCRERITPDKRTQNGRPGVPKGQRLGRAAAAGPVIGSGMMGRLRRGLEPSSRG